MPISNAGAIGVVIRADGVVETTKGVQLTAVEVKKLGEALTSASNDSKAFAAGQGAAGAAVEKAASSFKAGATAAQQFEKEQKSLNATSIALVSTLTTLGVQGVTSFVASLVRGGQAAINNGAEVARLAEKYGVAAEQISTLRYAADLSDTSMEAVASGMDRLGKNAVQAARGVGEGRIAFEALGISVKTGEGALKSQDQLLLEVADRISRVEDTTTRATLAQMLFGRAGADLIPFLNNGAEGLQKLQDEGRKWAEISGMGAAEAKKLKDQQVEMKYASEALGKSLATDLLPRLNAVIKAYLDAKTNGDGWLQTIGRITSAVLHGSDAQRAAKELPGAEAELAHKSKSFLKAAELFGLDSAEAQRYKREMYEAKAARDSLKALIEVSEPTFFGDQPKGEKVDVKLPPKADRDGRAKESDFDKLAKSLQEKIAVEQLELTSTGKLTEARKLLAKLDADEAEGAVYLSEIERAQVEVWLDQLNALEMSNTAKKETARLNEESRRHYEQHLAQLERTAVQMDEQNRRTAEQNDEIGLTNEQLSRLRVQRAEAALAAAQQAEAEARLNDVSEKELDLLRKKTEAAAINVDLVRETGQRTEAAAAWKKQEEEGKRAADNIERSLSDSLMRGFERGETAGQAFWTSMKNLAKTTILQPVIKAIIDPYVQPLAKAGGAAGSAIANWFKGGSGGDPIPVSGAAAMSAEQLLWAGFQHAGGIAGVDASRRAWLPASTWTGARRYHSGGIAGDEVPAILRRGEEVLTQADPRHRANGGGGPVAVSVTINQASGDVTTDPAAYQRLGVGIRALVRSEIVEQRRNGGSIS